METKKINLKKLTKEANFSDAMIKRNFIEFQYLDDNDVVIEKLRIRQLNVEEEIEVTDKRNELKIQLFKNPNYVTRDQLVKLYKDKGINIDDLDKQWEELQKEQEQYQNTLTELNNTSKEKPEEINRLEGKIEELEEKKYFIASKKVDLLSCSIDDNLTRFWNLYNTYLRTEVHKKEKWVKKWKSHEEMLKDNPDLVGLCLLKFMELMSGFTLPMEF